METSNELHENNRRCRPGRRIDVGIRCQHYRSGRDIPIPAKAMANWKQLAWSGALLITLIVLAVNIVARIFGARGSQNE